MAFVKENCLMVNLIRYPKAKLLLTPARSESMCKCPSKISRRSVPGHLITDKADKVSPLTQPSGRSGTLTTD